jgi:Holliday junction resolvase
MTEKQFENKVKRFLKDAGCWYIKYWAGAAYTQQGVPDLLICCNGHFVAVELKSERGRLSALQMWNINQIGNAGGWALVLHPSDFEDFKARIRELKER